MKTSRFIFALVLLLGGVVWAGEVIPPPPSAYFNDYAKVVSPATAQALNQKLQQFERETSNQIVVAIFPKMQSDSSIEDYTVRVAEAWKVGQKLKKNGAVLFVFIQDRKLYLQVGYGLEGALPDALAKRIIDNEITPRFKQGDYDGGLTSGVNAILAATKGEYKGTGAIAQDQNNSAGVAFVVIVVLIVLGMMIGRIARAHAWAVYSNKGHSSGIGWTWLLLSLFSGGGGGGGGSGGGGGFSFGGGGFSGGGGSFGGGGAGGSW